MTKFLRNELTQLRIETCIFQRNSGDDWEQGVIINEGDGPLIDMHGKVVPAPINDYRTRADGVMTVYSESAEK